MKLYDLTTEYQDILNAIEESEGELTPENLDLLDSVESAFEDKVDGYAAMIQTLLRQVEGYEYEEARLKVRRQALRRNVDSLRERLAANMARLNLDKVKGKRFSVSRQKYTSVQVFAIEAIPAEYLRVTGVEPKKSDIKAALEAGLEVPGCKLNSTEGVTIR